MTSHDCLITFFEETYTHCKGAVVTIFIVAGMFQEK
jgi:hypothetical protein